MPELRSRSWEPAFAKPAFLRDEAQQESGRFAILPEN
jgi:hypothetical protein